MCVLVQRKAVSTRHRGTSNRRPMHAAGAATGKISAVWLLYMRETSGVPASAQCVCIECRAHDKANHPRESCSEGCTPPQMSMLRFFAERDAHVFSQHGGEVRISPSLDTEVEAVRAAPRKI